ncbi:unnamed protein product [Adineta steineri]|uniref:Uncharacterized protein n=1 Tax=Adineta steineri TaxID=433720 RepID=A0A818U436_9BILA|nr:unnamed protein product [Adineta steineri]
MSVVTREINVRNTTEPIGCNGLPYQNINHTKLYYEVTSYSQVELPSCDNGKIDFLTFWFVIDDLCNLLINIQKTALEPVTSTLTSFHPTYVTTTHLSTTTPSSTTTPLPTTTFLSTSISQYSSTMTTVNTLTIQSDSSKKHSPNISLSTAAQLSDNQHVPIYSVDPIKLDTDHGYAIWRPVQQKT